MILLLSCTPKQPEFDKSNVLTDSNLNIQLEKDYDTSDTQVRHISWEKINYYPNTITVTAGKKVQIVGDLKRLQGCFRTFVIPAFDIQGQFVEGNNIIEFTPAKSGTYEFGCAMGMGKGTLIVN